MCCSTTTRHPMQIAAIVRAHWSFGTTALLPTLISDTPEKMRAALDWRAAGRARQPERPRHSPRRAIPVAAKAGRARSRDAPAAHGRGCRATDGRADRRHARHARARPGPCGLHSAARQGRHPSLAWSLNGHLCADQGGDGAGRHRLHAPLQRHASTGEPRARSGRRRARGRRAFGSA